MAEGGGSNVEKITLFLNLGIMTIIPRKGLLPLTI